MLEESPEARLARLGYSLPVPPMPIGRFRHGRLENGLLFLSGQGPLLATGELATGKVGRDLSALQAHAHAERVGLVLIAAMKAELGELGRVTGIVKLLGFVNCTADFQDHAEVIDGCSKLFEAVFARLAPHARSAVGVMSLPGGISVEIEAIVKVDTAALPQTAAVSTDRTPTARPRRGG